jgi:hypothetical protein
VTELSLTVRQHFRTLATPEIAMGKVTITIPGQVVLWALVLILIALGTR